MAHNEMQHIYCLSVILSVHKQWYVDYLKQNSCAGLKQMHGLLPTSSANHLDDLADPAI